MKVSRNKQPGHDLKVPHIVFCIGEQAAVFAASLMQKMRYNHRIVMISAREQISAICIKKYRTELQISPTIVIPLLMVENNTIYQIIYDYKTNVIECLPCTPYKTAS